MKIKRLALTLSVALSLPTMFSANASGFPVVDLSGFIQRATASIEGAAEFKENIDAARKQINEIKNQSEHYKAMVEGHYNFEDIINDPYVSDFMNSNNWNDDDLDDMRDEYELKSDNPDMQAHYDNLLRQQKLQEQMYSSSIQRTEKMKRLINEFSDATSPAEKEDLQNAMMFEQMSMQNDELAMSSLNSILEQQRRSAFKSRMRETERLLLGPGIQAPPIRPISDYQ